MIIEGQKWACQSCIRGHRVSNCTHADRELFPIAPKGRPVKQCEHCRSARKDKSHHAKCNCGNKKHKDSSESGPKIEGFGCACHKPGNKCICGIKSETSDLRIQEALLRRTTSVKCRPTLDTRVSESILTTGHPKHQHRNNLGHTSCQPYQKPKRPSSLHAPSYTDGIGSDLADPEPRAVDDMHLFNTNSTRMYGMEVPAMSADNLTSFPSAGFDSGIDFSNCFSSSDVSTPDANQLFRTTSADALSTQSGWYDNTLSTVAEAPGDFVTSPMGMYGDNEWNIPSATSDFFSPSDLPLNASKTNFSQTISHSGESNYQSVPGLTASSSGAQSEIDGPTGPSNLEAFPAFWSGTVQFRESTPVSGAPNGNVFAFPASVPNFEAGFKPTSSPRRHRQTYSGGSHHTHNGSGSTTVPGDFGFATNNVNIGHLQNLATLKSAREAAAARSASQSPSGFPLGGETDVGAITMPSSEDYYEEFDFPIQPPQASETSRQYSWLLDSQ